MTPQQKGETIEALIRYEGQVDRARRYLGLSKREMKTRARDVLSELPSVIADSVTRGLGIMVGDKPLKGQNITVEEVARRLSVLVSNEWNIRKAAHALDMTDSTLYSFIKRPRTREYAASNRIEIPRKFVYKPRTATAFTEPTPPTPVEIATVLIEALRTTAIIHSQAKDGLMAMQITLNEATEKAISEIFHIVRSSQNDRDISHL